MTHHGGSVVTAIALSTVFIIGCGGGPSSPSSTGTTIASTSTTSIPAIQARRYLGTYQPAAPSPALPLDLSLFFTIPGGAVLGSGLSARAVYNVSGGYNTGASGFTGSITGTFDGTADTGTFSGVMTANLPNGCVARRNYSGPMTPQALNWTPGAQVETCGGASPLTSPVTPSAAPSSSPATTSVTATTTTIPASTTSVQGTTTIASTTTTPTTTTTSIGSTTSTTTTTSTTITTSTTTTTVPPLTASYTLQGNECVLSSPSATCRFTASASGGVPPYTFRWLFLNPANKAQASASGQQVDQAFGCPFSNLQTFTIDVTMTAVASNGAQVNATGSHRADRSFTIVCTF